MDRLEAMRLFVRVTQAGNLSSAARQLRISPSAATRALAQLEEALGAQLVLRTTRSLKLTDQGASYLESCRRILRDVYDAEAALKSAAAAGVRGTLRISAPVVFGRKHVLPIAARLTEDNPELNVSLRLSDIDLSLVDERLDFGVRIGRQGDSSLIAIRLATTNPILVASPGYLVRHGTPQTLTDLAAHRLLAYEGPGYPVRWPVAVREALQQANARISLDKVDALISAAQSGVGLALVLACDVDDLVASGDLVRLDLDLQAPPEPIHLVYPRMIGDSPNLREFAARAREAWGEAGRGPTSPTLTPPTAYGVQEPLLRFG